MRLIDANALKSAITEYHSNLKPRYLTKLVDVEIADVLDIVDEQPTVDAVPVVHGRWEQCFEDWRHQIEGDKCSACGFEHYGCGIKHYHYCPNCGADMRERSEGE